MVAENEQRRKKLLVGVEQRKSYKQTNGSSTLIAIEKLYNIADFKINY